MVGDLDPETTIELARRGGKSYEVFEELAATPVLEATLVQISALIKENAEEQGAGYYAAQLSGGAKRVSWYAFHPELNSTDGSQAPLGPFEQRALAMCDYMSNTLHRTMEKIPGLIGAMTSTIREAGDVMSKANEQLRENAADAADVQIAALKEDRLSQRERMLGEFAAMYMGDKKQGEDNAAGLRENLAARLTAQDYDKVRSHPVAGELFKATSAMAFRDAAAKAWELINQGELVLAPESLRNLAPMVERLLSAPGGGSEPSSPPEQEQQAPSPGGA